MLSSLAPVAQLHYCPLAFCNPTFASNGTLCHRISMRGLSILYCTIESTNSTFWVTDQSSRRSYSVSQETDYGIIEEEICYLIWTLYHLLRSLRSRRIYYKGMIRWKVWLKMRLEYVILYRRELIIFDKLLDLEEQSPQPPRSGMSCVCAQYQLKRLVPPKASCDLIDGTRRLRACRSGETNRKERLGLDAWPWPTVVES